MRDECKSYPSPADTYKYPILPGTAAWDKLLTGDDRLKACQIPDSKLGTMSTAGLVQSWLDMPIKMDIIMANSMQTAIEFFIEKFSGLRELVQRNDAADELFKRYKLLDPACVTAYRKEFDKGLFILSFRYLELPLAQDTILNKMTLEQKKELMKEALNKYYARGEYPQYYDWVTNDLSLFICAKTMRNCQYQPFLDEVAVNNNLQWFIRFAVFYIPTGDYSAEKKIIIAHSLNFIQ